MQPTKMGNFGNRDSKYQLKFLNKKAGKFRYALVLALLILVLPAFPSVNAYSHKIAQVATIKGLGGPAAIDILPSLNSVYVANFGTGCSIAICTNFNDTISVISTTSNSIASTITVGAGPFGLAANPETDKVYVADFYDGTVYAIDGTTNTVSLCTTLAPGITGIAVNPESNIVYVTNFFAKVVFVLDGTGCNLVVPPISVGNGPIGIAVNPESNIVYVTNLYDGSLTVIDGETNQVVTTIPVGIAPTGVAVNPETNTIYVANSGFWSVQTPSNTVSVINGETNAEVKTIQVGLGPAGVAVDPERNLVYVTNFGTFNNPGTTVSVISGDKVVGMLKAGLGPSEAITNPDSAAVYVINFYNNTATAFASTNVDN